MEKLSGIKFAMNYFKNTGRGWAEMDPRGFKNIKRLYYYANGGNAEDIVKCVQRNDGTKFRTYFNKQGEPLKTYKESRHSSSHIFEYASFGETRIINQFNDDILKPRLIGEKIVNNGQILKNTLV